MVVLLEVDIGGCDLTFLIDDGGQTFIVQTYERNREQSTVGITLKRITAGADQADDVGIREQFGDLCGSPREGKVGGPVPILCADIMGGERSLDTMRLHGSDIGLLATVGLGFAITDQVVVVTPIEVGHQVDTVVEEAEVNTEVELMFLLIGQLVVSGLAIIDTDFLLTGIGTPNLCRAEDRQGIRSGCRLTGQRVAQTQFAIREPVVMLTGPLLEPVVLRGSPASTDVPSRQPAALAGAAQLVGTIAAHGDVGTVDTFE